MALLNRFSQDKEKLKQLSIEFQSSPTVYEFLNWLLNKDLSENVFSDGYGEERAKADGKALEALELLSIINGVYNARKSDPDPKRT